MQIESLRTLLENVRTGAASTEDALAALRDLPFEDLGFAKVDHHRSLRQGFPEVIFGEGKTPEQIAQIAASLAANGSTVLATRTNAAAYRAVLSVLPTARFHEAARIIAVTGPNVTPLPGTVGILCAGTTDIPVAEEAAITLEVMGTKVERIYDVGVAGLQRLLHFRGAMQSCDVLIVAAGMEGALPSVVGGLVDVPVIAVPTSVGYGAAFGGLAALLGMLNSCAKGLAVVNIDNGFGAAAFAASILRTQERLNDKSEVRNQKDE